MSGPLGSQQWMYNAGGSFYPYSIDQSLRFNDDDSAYLSRTPASAGNLDAWTFSAWVKRGNLGVGTQTLFGASSDVNNWMYIGFTSANVLTWNQADAGSVTMTLTTSQVFRDVGSFYHILCKYDSAQATAADRQEIYINGTKITAFGTATRLGQNVDSRINRNIGHTIGRLPYSSAGYFDGYMAEVNFIDGTALDATSFGETINGIWVPKAYSGSYGTNGFYLSFADSAAIGDDLSGNTNDWTATNLAASDVVLDSPTNNFPTINVLDPTITTSAISEANLKITEVANNLGGKATFAVPATGKWYWEAYCNCDAAQEMWNGITGITTNSSGDGRGGSTNSNTYGASWSNYSGSNFFIRKYIAGVESAESGSFGTTPNTVLGIAIDRDANEAKFYKDNALQFTTSISSTQEYFPAGGMGGGTNATTIQVWNFGQDSTFAGNKTAGGNTDDNGIGDFFYAPPSGFLALNSANLPEPAIGPNSDTTSDQHFNTVLYTGTGATQSITGVGFQPDWTWVKRRSGVQEPSVTDSVRGVNAQLRPASAAAESAQTDALTSFDSDGFTLGADATNRSYNYYTDNHVAWNWKADGTAVSNTDGSITSSVSANQDAGMSIATWTGNQIAGATVGHGLSQAPEMYIVKARGAAASWAVYHSALGATKWLLLNSTQAATTSSQEWNNTEPTSTVVSLGTSSANSNQSTTYVGYFFHSVEGHSKVGSYVGNGSTDGTFVYTGFRPAFLLIGKTAVGGGWNWQLRDSVRGQFNVDDNELRANSGAAELS